MVAAGEVGAEVYIVEAGEDEEEGIRETTTSGTDVLRNSCGLGVAAADGTFGCPFGCETSRLGFKGIGEGARPMACSNVGGGDRGRRA
jgi:hypothetical protein